MLLKKTSNGKRAENLPRFWRDTRREDRQRALGNQKWTNGGGNMNCRQCETAQMDLSSRRAPSNRARRLSNSCLFATISSDGRNSDSQSAFALGPVSGSFAVSDRGSASSSASTSDWSRIIGTLSVYRCIATVRRYSVSIVRWSGSITHNRNSSAPQP
jgi:hypothetical protein